MSNFENNTDIQPPLPYPQNPSGEFGIEATAIIEPPTKADGEGIKKNEITATIKEYDRNKYLTKDGRDIDEHVGLGIRIAVESFIKEGVDTISAFDLREILRFRRDLSQVSLSEHEYNETFPNIIFLEDTGKTDSRFPNVPNMKMYRILKKEFNEYNSYLLSTIQKIKAIYNKNPSAEPVKSIIPENSPSEEIGLCTLLETVLSGSRAKYQPKSDYFSTPYKGEGILTKEPFVTEILKIMELDTQKYRWLAEEILKSANEKNMLATLENNNKNGPFFVLNSTRKIELGNIENDLKTIEMTNFIKEKRNYALSRKKEGGTENIQDTLTGLEWQD